MKLYFDNECLGEIDSVATDDFWHVGVFTPYEPAAKFSELFAFLTKEDKLPGDEPPVNDDVIFGDHWRIVDEFGNSRKITAPGVHIDGQISWQWT